MSIQPMSAELGPLACLPANWKTVRFGDVCRVQGGFAFKSADYQKEGVPLVRISNLVNAKVRFDSDTVHLSEAKLSLHTGFILKKGDTLIAMSGATTGKMATYDLDTPALLNQRVGRFRILSEDSCSPRFISLLVKQITKKVLKEAYGAAQPNISPTQIEQFEIPLPPLDEQLRIVEEIEKQFTRLDSGVAALRRVQANLKRYRAAVLKAACEGQLVPTEAELQTSAGKGQKGFESGEQLLKRILLERRQNWKGRGKYKEPAAPDTANVPPLPAGWTWVSWEMVLASEDGAFKRGPFGSALTKSIFVKKGFKVYEQYCPINDDCSFVRYYITPEKFEELKAFEVKAGDYLISCSGVTLGRITRVPEQFEPGIINQALLRVRIDEKFINHRYFLNLFRSALFQEAIFDNSTGSAIPNVKGVKELKAMAIPLPSLSEQTRIVHEVERRFSVVEQLESVVATNLQRASRLRQSILQKAFTGKLTS